MTDLDVFVNKVLVIVKVIEHQNFKNKKEIAEEINTYLTPDMQLSYSQWKHLWQKDSRVSSAFKDILDKQEVTVKNTFSSMFPFWDNVIDDEYDDDLVIMQGVTASEQVPNPQETYQKMRSYFDKTTDLQSRKSKQAISFTGGPICLVNIADIHFGGAVDIARVFDDIELVNSTPRMYINFLGDLGNNFIGNWTKKINHNSPFTIEEEHAISRYYIQQVSKRLISFTSGNHDLWSAHESGIDIMKTYLNEIGSHAFYDEYENTFTIDVDGRQSIVKTRHEWAGSSQYNDTHAIEKAAKFDQSTPFDIGVGGHTHRSGLYREFNNGGKTGVAILCGTYKKVDDYARENGFTKANKSTAVCVVIDPDSETGYHGISDIASASKYMKLLYS